MLKKLIVGIALNVIATSCLAFTVPELKAHVNDYANLMSAKTIAEIEKRLADYETQTSRQFAILTIDTLCGKGILAPCLSIEEAAIKVANAWGLGSKKDNNGLLLIVVKKERGVRIEVGSGIEDVYTDLFTGRIIDDVLVPNFKSQKFDEGLTEAVNELLLGAESQLAKKMSPQGIIILIVLVIIIIVIIAALVAEGNGYGGGGGSSGWSSFGGGSSSGSSSSGFSGGGGSFSGGGSSGRW